jgi:hypothetical protein
LTTITIALYLPSWLRLGTLHYQEFKIIKNISSITFPVEDALPFSFTMQFEENSIVEAMRAGTPKYANFPDYWYGDGDWRHSDGH